MCHTFAQIENYRGMTADQLVREVSRIVASLGDSECADLLQRLKQIKSREGFA